MKDDSNFDELLDDVAETAKILRELRGDRDPLLAKTEKVAVALMSIDDKFCAIVGMNLKLYKEAVINGQVSQLVDALTFIARRFGIVVEKEG